MVKAAVLHGPRDIRMESFAVPEIGEDAGLMEIEACGICAADYPVYDAGRKDGSPVILGHEIVGRVGEIGPIAEARWGVAEGARVVVERWIPCGHCEQCLSGVYRLCSRTVGGDRLNFGGTPTHIDPGLYGGYSELLFLHPESVVYPVADDIPATLFPLFTPLGNAISWLTSAGQAAFGDTVVIIGPGQEGLAAVVAAKAVGLRRIVVIGLPQDQSRLDVAADLGATLLLVEGHDDIPAAVARHTDGALADVVLDVTSTTQAAPLARALSVAGVGAHVVAAAFHTDEALNLDTNALLSRQISIHGVFGRERWALKSALRMIESDSHQIERLTSHHVGLDQVEKALQWVGREHTPDGEDVLHVSVVPSA